MKRISVAETGSSERLALNAGAIEVDGTLGDAAIPADRLSLAIYVPDHNNPEAKLVVAGAKPGQVICLPEGSYHIVSTYLDTEGVGSLTPVSDTNSMVGADLRVQAGKTDIGHYVGEKVQPIAGIVDTRTVITFKAF